MNAHCCLLAAAAAVEYSLRDTPKVEDVRDELGVCVCVSASETKRERERERESYIGHPLSR